MENEGTEKKYSWLFILFISLILVIVTTATSMLFSYVAEKSLASGFASGFSFGIAFSVIFGLWMRLGIAKPSPHIVTFATKTGLDKYIFQAGKGQKRIGSGE